MEKTFNQILLDKLDAFIRKYYQNLLLKGAIIFIGIFVFTLLVVTALEYFGRYTTQIRAILFYSMLMLSLLTFIRFIFLPLLKLFRIGKVIGYEEAASIIGKHFPQVSDKLLNALQLISTNDQSNVLLLAAIEQKTEDLSPLPFQTAIDFKSNLKYARFAAVPLLIFIFILIFSPAFVSESAKRLINYDKAFKVPAPFNFIIKNDSLRTSQYQDFTLQVQVDGQKLPNDVYLVSNGQKYRLDKVSKTEFAYVFKNLQSNTTFYLEALGFEDATRTIEVFAKPVMVSYSATFNYPAYLGLKNETVQNPGDITIPAGTTISWNFTGKQTSEISLFFQKMKAVAKKQNDYNYSYQKKFFVSDAYSIVLSNDKIAKGDSLHYSILVQPDTYPSITIEQKIDSLTGKYIYLAGMGADDHGLVRLSFNYKFVKSNNKDKTSKGLQIEWIEIPKEKRVQINHIFDLYTIGFEPSDELEYYFEIWDNDGVTGSKSTRSEKLSIKAPGKQALKEQSEAESNALEKKMQDALSESKELQSELNKLQDKLKSQQPLSWEEKKKLEQLLNQQKQLQEKLKNLQQDFKQKNIKEQAFKEEQERILEKQEQLQKMYEQLMNEEMKQLMKQLENMMKMQNKEQIKKELDKMEISNKDVEKELDRMLEMYKELEVDKKLEDAMKDLKNLADEQRNLKQDVNQKDGKDQGQQQALQQKQEELKEKFENLQKDLRTLEKKNSELESPKKLADTKNLEQQIKDKMEQSSQELKKGNEKKASEKMEDAANDLDKMEQEMEEQKEKDEEDKEEIDAQALREILENLIQLSKDQEETMEELKQITGYNPKFVALAQKQKILQGNAKMIEDSLLSISKRAPEVKSFINKEITKMNAHLNRSNLAFSQRNLGEVRVQQQYAMTNMNNLAVMLSESLKEMQQKSQQKQKSKQGKGKGKPKPGGSSSKPSMSQLKKMQQEMNKQMQEGMNKNGSSKPGGGQMSSEQFARMAAQQMAIRQQMQKMLSQMDALEKEKLGGGKALGDLQKLMEETEKDLFNKRLTQETIMRQQDILTRLLEHEKAEKKQEQEQKRESEQGKEKPRPSPQYLEQLNIRRNRETEILQSVPAELQPYYKQKAKEYLERAE